MVSPTSPRKYTQFTTEARETFLKALRQVPNVTYAAQKAGVNRRTVYLHKDRDPEFAEAWLDALEEGADMVELEAHKRAVQGWQEPVFYQGMVVGYLTRYSDALLARLLQAHRPEKFSEKFQHQGSSADPLSQALATIDGTTVGPPAMRETGTLPEPTGRTFDHVLPGEEEDDPE